MLLARVCRGSLAPQITSILKAPVVQKPQISRIQNVRLFTNNGRTEYTRATRWRVNITKRVVVGDTAHNLGRGALAGASALGLGALCYYGLGLSPTTGAIDRAGLWPDYVRDRIHSTYMYVGGSIGASALSAAACLRSPAVMNLVMRKGWMALVGTMVAIMGTGMIAQSLPYKEGFGKKQVAWLLHTGVIGAVLAPICLRGGPLILRVAIYTAGAVGGLSAVAVCAPSEKFLNWTAPLGLGLGLIIVTSVRTIFLPPTKAIGAGLQSFALYGGLILFSWLLMQDTQRIIHNAEPQPLAYGKRIEPYDPINHATSIYLDTILIFVRILSIVRWW